ncbi:MAG: cold shock domain-containing protein [Actinomycetia bacterium]|nr:cold shock domain-containing protein [Actinomycetes bacterium]MCP4222673.1 cold shock domain-containing protein [Actinomycetes bacterium]MCP5034575.1 cold shock domain-containing protein [Actinomycetes bacterium]
MVDQGSVTSFDADAGLGEIEDDSGAIYGFHCTAIAGGSRQIEIGKAVAFIVEAGGPGRWEATRVTPLD